jgi:type I restriction enzyme S subunit
MSSIPQLLTEYIDIWTAADIEKKSGRGRNPSNVASVYGIKKLRELILELAVHGKLVPQDLCDEPASRLLELMQAKKVQLIAEAKIKKSKMLRYITEEEKPFELPQGWEWVRLPDVSDYKVGKTPSTKSSTYWTNACDGINWVSIADLNHGGHVLETTKHITDKAVSEVFRCDPTPVGTILMSFKLTLGKISILEVPAFHNEAIISIYPNQSVFKNFLFKVLPARAMDGNSKSAIKGSTLNSESIAALLIPLPPMAEQHRIVSKVDELMALCDQMETKHKEADDAHKKLVCYLLSTLTLSQSAQEFSENWQRIATHFDILFTTESSIDVLKQTLLQLAIMGMLIPQDPNDEPTSELLKRIRAEKNKLMAEGKIRKGKPLPPITDEDKPFKPPETWKWVRLGELVEKSDAGWSPSCENHKRTGSNWGVLKVSAVSWGKFLPNENKALPKTLEPRLDCVVTTGDFLVSRANTAELVAKSVVVEDCPLNLMLSDKIVRLQLSKLCDNRFINIANSSPFARSYYLLMAGGTSSTMKNVTREQILNLMVAVPPLAEQRRIVAKVGELTELCGQLKSTIFEAHQLQQKLADVIVEQGVA